MRPIALFLVILLFPTFALAEKVALVIGNARYTAVPELSNPENDSAAVAAALTEQGFQVTRADNLGRTGLYDALRGFREAAVKEDNAIVYYAGHGIEVAGDNYIVSVDARLEDERDASVEMVNIDVVLRQISGVTAIEMRDEIHEGRCRFHVIGRNADGAVETDLDITLTAHPQAVQHCSF